MEFDLPPDLKKLLVEYQPPLDKICPWCGAKHTGYFQACDRCKRLLDAGQ